MARTAQKFSRRDKRDTFAFGMQVWIVAFGIGAQ